MSTAPKTSPAKNFQSARDLFDLKRSAFHSHFRQRVDVLADSSRFPRLSAFLPQNVVPWVVKYLQYAFRRKHPFLSYPPSGERGVYRMAGAGDPRGVKVSIAGDWGTGTEEASVVADAMMKFDPDYTIHLGDVYYVADLSEIRENCMGQPREGYQGVTWPKGKLGSFTMNGNHEMYANGDAYFDYFIGSLGIPGSQDGRQLTSYFCLQNETWRILCLDTGYNSVGKPVLGQIPILNKIPWIGANCRLEDAMMEWLRTTVKLKEEPRATILLTHQQYFSAFEEAYTKPASQLMEFFAGQDVIWIWGHEHRWAIYDRFADGAFSAYGRCVGHGGMPIEFADPKRKAAPALQYYDRRVYKSYGDRNVGFNGFLNLSIQGNTATLDHRDVNNTSILVETFAVSEGRISHRFDKADPELSKGPAVP